MTLPLNSRLSALYDTNGTQKDFGFGFRVFFDPDNGGYGLEVRRQTADGYEVIPKSDYLVLPVEDNSAGVVRFSVAPSAGQQIYIAGKTPTIQQLVLTNFGRYSAESIETQFDFITAIIQEWLSALGEETRQRIAADEILTQYVVQRIDDFVQQVNQNWDDKSQEIEDYIATIMPSFTQTLRDEIEAYAVAGMQDAIDQTLAESKAEIDDAVARANAAALAAAITGKVYDTPEAGVDPVTGVANGAYYNVRSTDDYSYLVEYQNVGGVPTPSGKSYPSSSYVQNMSERLEDLSELLGGVSEYVPLPFKPGKTYALNERVQLENGDIVRSTIPNNTTNPNTDKTGWSRTRTNVLLEDFKRGNSNTWADALELATALSGVEIDCGGLTIPINRLVVGQGQNLRLKNLTMDASGISQQTGSNILLSFSGSQSANINLTADTLVDSNIIRIADTSIFPVDGWVWLESNADFASSGLLVGEVGYFAPIKKSQVARIKSKTVNTLTLYDDVLYDFKVSDSAVVALINAKSTFKLDNVKVVGAGQHYQTGILFDRCVDVEVNDLRTDQVDYAGIQLERCIHATINRPRTFDAQQTGTSYGIVVSNGCHIVTINDPYGEDLRHTVTVGGRPGINHYVTVNDVTALGMRDAGVDSHPAGNFITFNGGYIQCAASSTDPKDGVVMQGQNGDISGIKVVGCLKFAVAVSSYAAAGVSHSASVRDILIEHSGYTSQPTQGISINTVTPGTLDTVEISGIRCSANSGKVSSAVYIEPKNGAIKDVLIHGNPKLKGDFAAVYVNASNGSLVDGITISSNALESATNAAITLLGKAGANNIKNIIINGNRSKAGSAAHVRFINCETGSEVGNIYFGATARPVTVEGGSKFISVDRSKSPVRTVTTSAATINVEDEKVVCARAASAITITLPVAADWPGREITFKRVYNFSVDSAFANVVPLNGVDPGTNILPAVSGSWVTLKSDGVNWVAISGSAST